ncbi:MAG TPA: efflux RND transporter periplasmic adaptor subunit [Verrucomicrobiae bacterium]|jgi:multidrug efflux pump subunit AcrA (membrane-fusion protein)
MNAKQILSGLIFISIAALGIFAIARHRSTATEPSESDDAPTQTVVTVQTGALKIATLHRYVQGYGTVGPAPATTNAPSADAVLSASVAGVITKVAVVQGQHVEKGDLLMELNSGTATVEYATQQLQRQKSLYAQQNTSLKNLQDAELQLALLRVTSPLSGTVTHLNVRAGQAVDLTTAVAEVIDLDRLAVNAEIPVTDAAELKPGEPVEILTEPPVNTEISFISPDVNASNATVLVRALVNAGSALRPGQFVILRAVTAVHTNVLAAPAECVVTDDDGKSFIALIKGDEAARTPVQTGLREEGLVEISAPELKSGDVVATVGAYGLPEKTKIIVQTNSVDAAPADSAKAQ